MQKKKIMLTFALSLMLSITISMIALPLTEAHTPPWDVPTWTYVAVTNEVIGVGQTTVIVFWSNAVPPTAQGKYGDAWTFWIDITSPAGVESTLGPFLSDPVGGSWTTFTPTEVGDYTIVARMDSKKIDGSPNGLPPGFGAMSSGYNNMNDTYLASQSDPITLIVQEAPIPMWPEAPLPDSYWTRPINAMSRNQFVLAGNWLAGAAQVNGPTQNFGYGLGPESAHILWASPMWSGGIMDERFGETGYQTAHYEGLSFTPPIILDGKIFYNVQSLPREGWFCLDLYTGETLYFHNTTGPVVGTGGGFSSSGSIAGEALSFGQIYDYESPNQHGGFPYLWSKPYADFFGTPNPNASWMMFDAYSGNYICSINNIPSWATGGGGFFVSYDQVYGKDGSITSYHIQNYGNTTNPNNYLQVWNTSQAIWYKPYFASNDYWMWRPTLNKTFDGNNGYSLNVSIGSDISGTIYAVREGNMIIGGTAGKNSPNETIVQGNLWALNLDPSKGPMGATLWNRKFTPPQTTYNSLSAFGTFTSGAMSGPVVDPEDGVFLYSESLSRNWWCYSLDTMQQLWKTSTPEAQMNFYGLSYNIYQGKLLSLGYAGVMNAYDIKTGELLWNYTAAQYGDESPYGNYPIGIACVADGKLYLTSSEHSPTQPLWRGSYLRCVNASNGVELWKINNWGAGMGAGSGAVVADGNIVTLNLYDNRIYCYGKGASATTVAASPEVSTFGSTVLITGTVTDDSRSGSRDINGGLETPLKGTPAICDADMQAWMEYLFMDQGKPLDLKGVDVVFETLDPNGNYYKIGNTTSDGNGNYGFAFHPEVPGLYTIFARFDGTHSYYPSSATTYLSVDEVAPTATPQPAVTLPQTETYILGVGIAIIIAVAIVGVVLLMAIRKRP
jgi:hypothetical protein